MRKERTKTYEPDAVGIKVTIPSALRRYGVSKRFLDRVLELNEDEYPFKPPYYLTGEEALRAEYLYPNVTGNIMTMIANLSGASIVALVHHNLQPSLSEGRKPLHITGIILDTGYFVFWPVLIFEVRPSHIAQDIANIEDIIVSRPATAGDITIIKRTHFSSFKTIENTLAHAFKYSGLKYKYLDEGVRYLIKDLNTKWGDRIAVMPKDEAAMDLDYKGFYPPPLYK